MRIAIPIADGRLHPHFGHCQSFALIDIDPNTSTILAASEIAAPEHQPGLLPPWLKERGVDLVIAGNMGSRARSLFATVCIETITGAPPEDPTTIARHYLAGTLVTRENTCDH